MKTIRYGSEFWRLHADGAIERPGLVAPNAAAWRVTGAVTRNNFGHITARYSLADILGNAPIPWSHANGAQKTFVRDFDHGAVREWRSPNHSIT